MTYSKSVNQNARMLTRTVTGLFDFSGRSRRTELAYFWGATALLGGVLNFDGGTTVAVDDWRLIFIAFGLLIQLPIFALFVRRLHDQDRSGWWGWTLPLAYLFNIEKIAARARGDVAGVVAAQGTPEFFAALFCFLVVFSFMLAPGTVGPNRYGPDPRPIAV